MLFKPKDLTPSTEITSLDQRLMSNHIEAHIILEVKPNSSNLIQDYDLLLSSGQAVVLRGENCGGKVPSKDDYFFINPVKPYIFIFTKSEFLELYEKV